MSPFVATAMPTGSTKWPPDETMDCAPDARLTRTRLPILLRALGSVTRMSPVPVGGGRVLVGVGVPVGVTVSVGVGIGAPGRCTSPYGSRKLPAGEAGVWPPSTGFTWMRPEGAPNVAGSTAKIWQLDATATSCGSRKLPP